MAENKTLTEWRIIGETIPGASHIRAGIPNQDSILYVRESNRTDSDRRTCARYANCRTDRHTRRRTRRPERPKYY